jgi:hypothetical protein
MLVLYTLSAGVEVLGVLLFVLGFIAIFRGKVALHRNLAVDGMPARVVGIMFTMITPLTMLSRFVIQMAYQPPRRPSGIQLPASPIAATLDFWAVMGICTVGIVAAIAVVAAYRKGAPGDDGPRNPFTPPSVGEELGLATEIQASAEAVENRPHLQLAPPRESPPAPRPAPQSSLTVPRPDLSHAPFSPVTKLAIVGAGVALLFGTVTTVAFVVSRSTTSLAGFAGVPGAPAAPGVLFADSFNRTTPGPDWKFEGGSWRLAGGILSQTDTGFADPRKAMVITREFPANLQITARVRVDAWEDGEYARAGIGLATESNGEGYNLAFRWHQDSRHHVAFLDDGRTWGNAYGFEWQFATWYWFRLKRENGVLYGKVWADGTAEPPDWPYVQRGWTDRRGGVPALNGGSGVPGAGNARVSFADVGVIALTER